MQQAAQIGCGVSVLGDTKNPHGYGPGQPAPADPALRRGMGLEDLQRYLQPQQFCASVMLLTLLFRLLFCETVGDIKGSHLI